MIDYDQDPEFKPLEYGYYWYKQRLLDWDHEPHWYTLKLINGGNFKHAKFPDWTIIRIYRTISQVLDDEFDDFREEYHGYGGGSGSRYIDIEGWAAKDTMSGAPIPNNRIRQLQQMGTFIKIEEPK